MFYHFQNVDNRSNKNIKYKKKKSIKRHEKKAEELKRGNTILRFVDFFKFL